MAYPSFNGTVERNQTLQKLGKAQLTHDPDATISVHQVAAPYNVRPIRMRTQENANLRYLQAAFGIPTRREGANIDHLSPEEQKQLTAARASGAYNAYKFPPYPELDKEIERDLPQATKVLAKRAEMLKYKRYLLGVVGVGAVAASWRQCKLPLVVAFALSTVLFTNVLVDKFAPPLFGFSQVRGWQAKIEVQEAKQVKQTARELFHRVD